MASFSLSNKDIEQLLKGVDFSAVKDFFALSYNVAREKHFIDDVIKTEFHNALQAFMSNPCKDSAITLLEKYPHLADVFETSKSVSNTR